VYARHEVKAQRRVALRKDDQVDEIDLYIDGADFYSGSTAKALKNGWCNFRKLGRALAQRHFGTSVDVGKIYYLNSAIGPSATTSYEEATRKRFWMGALRQEVDPLIIQRSADAELVLARPEDGPCALVIAAGRNQFSPTEKAVRARYSDNVALAIPPDCELSRSDAWRFSHSDLEAAHLGNAVYAPDALYRWDDYVRSKEDSRKVSEYYKEAENRLRGFFENALKKRNPNPSGDDLPWEIKRRLHDRVERELRTSNFDDRLARSRSCRDFITEKTIASTTALVTDTGVSEEVPAARPEPAGPPARRVEIADTFQRALQRLERKDRLLGELCSRRISDFQMNPAQPGFGLERLSKDPNLWSLRVNDDIRIIAHHGLGVFTLWYVGHHAEAYRWAERQ